MSRTRNRRAARWAGRALVTAAFAATPALAQEDYGTLEEETSLDEEIPDVEIPDVEIPDVEIPDVRVGANDAVLVEEEEPPPTAVFNEAPSAAEVDARARAEAARDEARSQAQGTDAGDGTQPAFAGGNDAALDNTATGDVRAIDLVDGTLEVETDTRGTLIIRAQQEQLRQLAPGQSISLSYVDRDDGRWLSRLQLLRPPVPPASSP